MTATVNMRLHHLGFVVADIRSSARGFIHSLAANWDGYIYHDPHQKVGVTFLATRTGDPLIELIEPAGEDSPVFKFLQAGGGLHHVCYEVPDLDLQLKEMRARGALICRRPKPAVAFQGRRIAWLLTPERLLMELLDAQDGHANRNLTERSSDLIS